MSSSRFLQYVFLLFITTQLTFAQTNSTSDKYPKASFNALVLGRYVYSLTDDVDINGKHSLNNDALNNSFTLNLMRVYAKAWLNPKTEINLLANLADFKHNPETKVLENAYVKYHFSPKFNIVLGQYRPAFGQESTYSGVVHKSLQWSNQYKTFGGLGWTSFQVGIGLNWQSKIGQLPFKYSLSVINGNGKNRVVDNDNGKHLISRFKVDLDPKHKLSLAVYGGLGVDQGKDVHAYGIDGNIWFDLTDKTKFNFRFDASQGINHELYFDAGLPNDDIKDYQVKSLHLIPYFNHKLDSKNATSVDCSVRYEILDRNAELNSQPHQTITPMVGVSFLENYKARLQLGVIMDRFSEQVEGSKQYDRNLMVVQAQYKF